MTKGKWEEKFDSEFTNLKSEPDCLYTITTVRKPSRYKAFIRTVEKEAEERERDYRLKKISRP